MTKKINEVFNVCPHCGDSDHGDHSEFNYQLKTFLKRTKRTQHHNIVQCWSCRMLYESNTSESLTLEERHEFYKFAMQPFAEKYSMQA